MADADFYRAFGWTVWGVACVAMAIATYPAPHWWAWLLAITGGVVILIPLPLGDADG